MTKSAKPFLKWAGGKTQLLPAIDNAIPDNIRSSKFTYIEPFVGSGAVFFWMVSTFENMERAVINYVNGDLINTYRTIANSPHDLIEILQQLQTEYHDLQKAEERKKEYYYEKRDLFNTRNTDKVTQAALFIFLNRSCFNGLYRVNSKNLFNVPMGSYSMPTICDAENLFAVSEALKGVEIINGDFWNTFDYAGNNTLFYFDPPYKPLNQTSSFNSYAMDEFNDESQIRLRDFCNLLDKKGHQWILSNSDVRAKDETSSFFDDIYSAYNIARVRASRRINANPEKRGELNELLITNYAYEEVNPVA